jgi:hypothetical protein
MKKAILTFVLIGLVGTLSAQYSSSQRSAAVFMQTMERASTETYYLPDDYIGSPYFMDTFLPGSIYENNEVVASDYYFRYNAIQDEIEVKESPDADDSEIKILTKAPDIYVKIMNDLFFYNTGDSNSDHNGYFQVLVVGNKFNLYKKLNKKLFPAKKARNSFEKDILATYKDKPVYYIVNESGTFFDIPDSKKKRVNAFGNKKADINKFIKHNNLNMSEEHNLIKAFKYFDSFKDARL